MHWIPLLLTGHPLLATVVSSPHESIYPLLTMASSPSPGGSHSSHHNSIVNFLRQNIDKTGWMGQWVLWSIVGGGGEEEGIF